MDKERPEVSIVPAKLCHIMELGNNMRKEDASEAISLGFRPYRLLYLSYRYSIMRKTALIDNQVAACWGCTGNQLGYTGRPWLITSDLVGLRTPLDYALLYRQEVKKMRELFPLLENWVEASYETSVRLLKIVGFTLDDPKPLGVDGQLFRRFWMKS